jgi:hypothetical protein
MSERSVSQQQVLPAAPQQTASRQNVLQRKCACGGAPGPTGECAACRRKKQMAARRHPLLQPKLCVNQPGDHYEREADRVAEQVMRMPATRLQPQGLDKETDGELRQRKPVVQRQLGSDAGAPAEMPPIVHEVVRSPGHPLDPETREFMESRFGHDFGQVQVHMDAQAVESAKAVNARAYTVGQNVVFGAGQYARKTSSGRRLLAHELTHVIQQERSNSRDLRNTTHTRSTTTVSEGAANQVAQQMVDGDSKVAGDITRTSVRMQRACGSTAINEPTGCTFSSSEVSGPRYLFRVNCDEFARGNEEDLKEDAQQIQSGEIVEVHGIASVDGDPTFNFHLSCARALRAKAVIEGVLAQRGVSVTLRVFHHGEREGDAVQQRSVIVTRTSPEPPRPSSTCGPDATDWFIRQVTAAKSDATVLAIQRRLTGAERVARRHGFSAEEITVGAVARRVLAEEARVGAPPRTSEASAQLGASVPGQRAFGRALVAAPVPLVGAPEAMVLAAVRGAALTWKGLVGTGKKYDFKNDPRTLQSPTSRNCPVNCANTITLCPQISSNCFIKDVPGNLFYAHVGRFVGWSELALQLGSQFAQLESSARWDPPEDTRMIDLGFRLPDPLTRTKFCSAINANRSIFILAECSNCDEEVTADVV